MSQWSTYLNYDVMGDLVFARRFNCMTTDAHRFVPRLLMNSTEFIHTYASMPFKAISRRVLASGVLGLPVIGGSMAPDDKLFYRYAENVLGERIVTEEKGNETRRDIMHYLLHATNANTERDFSRRQLNAESGLFIAAGADTTSLTLAGAVFYLLHNPRAMDVLVEEVRSACSAESLDEISPSKLVSLPYLQAVVDETLRLSPPVPAVLPREVLKGDLTIDDEFIPKGTVVGVSAYAIHHNPEYYPEHEAFYPERWIVGGEESAPSPLPKVPRTKEAVSIARQAFNAFSQGPRSCIGRQLAYHELHTALALLLDRFDMRLARDPQTQRLMKDSTSWREGLTPVLDPKDQKESWREERKREDVFQLIDHLLSDRNGPMVEFRHRSG